ncbi:unnamed protein product [Urochloa decumbens]|uniref:No apical meristem-associated C-terminal domain-containing protein n=1 Tax=Urochloa decumbens TaxID=240449 RepID=A0ABC9C5W5_9POAL
MDSPPAPSQPALLALFLVLLLALYRARRYRGAGKNRKYPPVAGTVRHQLFNFGRLVEYQTDLSRRHHTFRMLAPTNNHIYTVEPGNVEYILKTNFANYGKGAVTHDVLEDLLGDGIFNVDGAKWQHQRKVASHEFSTRVLRDYSCAVFRGAAAELAGVVAAATAGKAAVDMHDLLMRSTLDSIFKVGFGVSLGVLSGSSEEGAAFARAFDDASEQVLYRFFNMFWKAKRFLNVSPEAAMKRSVRTIDDFVYAVIDRKIEQMGGDQQEFDLGATPCQVPDGVRPRQVPDHAVAPGAFVPRQLFEAPPPVARLPSPLRHERRQEGASHAGSVFTGASRKGQAPSYSEPAQLPSHQVQKRPMEAAATASDTRRTASTTSMQDDGNYLSSSSMPFYDWSPTPTADYTMQDPMGSSSQSYVAMLTQENSEADLEVLTQAPLTDIGSSRGRGGNYNHTEDIQLCWSWMAITFDPRIGNDQPKSTYWNRIAQHYHDNKTFDSIRNANSLEKRWNTIQRECIRFQECFDKIERLRPSGVPQTEYINLAQKSFDETKGFPYIHCWMEVRHTQKFQFVYEAMKQATQGSRHSKSTVPSQEAQEEDRAPSERPPGRKKSKQKLKRNDGEDDDVSLFQARKEDIVSAGAGARSRVLRQQVPPRHHTQLRDRRPRHHGGTLSWFLYVLCRNDPVLDRIAVAEEARVATPGDRDVGVHELAASLTEDAISKMQYLHAALTETLRLYPAVPLDAKSCLSDDTLPDGYAPYAMGRMDFLWGPDAEEFRPERWLDDDGVFVPESPFKFTVFQAGPRICLGKEFAYRQMKIFAAVLHYLFRFQMWDANATVGYRPMITLKMDGPLYVRASPRLGAALVPDT